MYTSDRSTSLWDTRKALERNHYFYGMLMDVFHFERERDYFNARRYLLNRLVSGYGVVCGLDVRAGQETNQIYIEPGVAIDKWGREIIVPQEAGPYTIPDITMNNAIQTEVPDYYMEKYHHRHPQNEVGCVQVLLCYQECETDPAPALAGDCSTAEPCMPSTIREQFEVHFDTSCDEPEEHVCQIDELIENGRINYAELTRWVTDRDCFDLPDDPCIPLANVMLVKGEGHRCDQDYIKTEIRPLCYSNDLLFQLILGLVGEKQRDRVSRK